ncbi:MAG: sterol desaturase family protein, partial [Pseudomonadota bacterium]
TFAILKSMVSMQVASHGAYSLELDLSSLGWFAIAMYSVFHFVIDDFARFAQHKLMHQVPFLWEFHKVHHSALNLTPLTLYRLHSFELALASLRRISTTLVTALCVLLLTDQMLSPAQILGVTALSFVFNLFGANLRHSEIPIRFGFLEKIFISPFLHQIHHSNNPEHFDKNFGVSLSLWDRAFGSYLNIETCELRFGLSDQERNHDMSLLSATLKPTKQAFYKAIEPLKAQAPSISVVAQLLIAAMVFVGCDNSSNSNNPPAIKNVNEGFVAKGVQTEGYNDLHGRLQLQADNLNEKLTSCEMMFADDMESDELLANWEDVQGTITETLKAFHKLEPLMWEIDLVNSKRNLLRGKIYS